MKRSLYIITVLIFCLVFAGCKIEFPEDISDYNSECVLSNDSFLSFDSISSDIDKEEESVLDTSSYVNNESSQTQAQTQTQTQTPQKSDSNSKVTMPDKPAVTQQKTDSQVNTQPKPEPEQLYCYISIDCKTILNNMDSLAVQKKQLVPQNGIILPLTKVSFTQGESAFDILLRITKQKGIHMEFVNTPAYKSAYIEGINNLYEFDCGPLSGWMYNVNGEYQSDGVSQRKVNSNDKIEFRYTCNLGEDLGN